MSTSDWIVVLGGVAAIAWVNWYFFMAEGRAVAAATVMNSGPQQVEIAVQGGYEPRVVHVKAGRPVRLVFDRQETSSCSEEIVFSDFNIRRFLPAFQKTVVEITPDKPGTYEFTCGMSMLRGKVIAE
jgi:plastocyanin domain-containing protein